MTLALVVFTLSVALALAMMLRIITTDSIESIPYDEKTQPIPNDVIEAAREYTRRKGQS